MRGLQTWMRVVGLLYVLTFLVSVPPFGDALLDSQYPALASARGTAAFQVLQAVSVEAGLVFGVVGVVLLVAAKAPQTGLLLVRTVLLIQSAHLLLGHAYGYLSGIETITAVIICAGVDALIIATGLRAVLRARSVVTSLQAA